MLVQCAFILLCPVLGALSDDARLMSDVCRVHREYSRRPQLLEARRAGRCRPGVRRVWGGAGPQRAAYMGECISCTACYNGLMRSTAFLAACHISAYIEKCIKFLFWQIKYD